MPRLPASTQTKTRGPFATEFAKLGLKYTNKQLAAKLGISVTEVSQFATGVRNPSWRCLDGLARAFPKLYPKLFTLAIQQAGADKAAVVLPVDAASRAQTKLALVLSMTWGAMTEETQTRLLRAVLAAMKEQGWELPA